ncbi:PTS system, mannitol-specific IIC component [Dethiosulfatibacter aminovorans DSM 17477]|uniref:Mannitol-specific phosphotransferase enzyme IIA component n=1 Tax=Dethiosulfatibacter aminovorans DSM 17477 TaxID=1121476 RepID=A0A1M6GCA0_9FIRM|nr:PTS mannitol transporter subunit IICBA [Dethiosulfatibacter aminovorans]SHJ07542.1 PTS system, mannitol-specific IIC component [Dethiosulfatibacter aminovorans DSM 17477]
MKDTLNNNTVESKSKAQQHVQKFGRFLSGMVMPNIGAFIVWGLITTLFIPTGWLPNENLASLVGPMIVYLLPLLIGYTGGKLVYGHRGGVLGAVATMGVIVGTDIPMFIGGMIMGPLGGYIIKKFDEAVHDKIPSGFEMLVNNFSLGIFGTVIAILGYYGIGPVVERISNGLGAGVEMFVERGLLPLASVFIEPAKVLFLNNAINHGVLSPLGIAQQAELGKSIFFLLETNPGPGLGILLAYWVFSKGMIKQSAPGAIIIHFLGGIHEIYFPYILMQPILILAVMAGGAAGVFTFNALGAGLVAVPSPGSIFALSAMAPKGGLLPVLAGVLVSTGISFLVASVLINKKETDEDMFESAKGQMIDLKGKESSVVKTKSGALIDTLSEELIGDREIKAIVVACDAGMGSSAMGAGKLRTALKKAGLDIKATNTSIDQLDETIDMVITHEKLTDRAKSTLPSAIHLSITDFLTTPVYEEIAEFLKNRKGSGVEKADEEKVDDNVEEATGTPETLKPENIMVGLKSVSKEEAIKQAGEILFKGGYVKEDYIEAMLQRDRELSTFIGNGTAIPHGVNEAKKEIKHTGISILQYPDGIDYDGNTVYLVVGIAGLGNEHLKILSNLAEIIEDEDKVEQLRTTKDVNDVYKQFTNKM